MKKGTEEKEVKESLPFPPSFLPYTRPLPSFVPSLIPVFRHSCLPSNLSTFLPSFLPVGSSTIVCPVPPIPPPVSRSILLPLSSVRATSPSIVAAFSRCAAEIGSEWNRNQRKQKSIERKATEQKATERNRLSLCFRIRSVAFYSVTFRSVDFCFC